MRRTRRSHLRFVPIGSGTGFPHVLVADHDPKVTRDVIRAFVRGMGPCLIVRFGWQHHKNTDAGVQLASGAIGDALRALASGS